VHHHLVLEVGVAEHDLVDVVLVDELRELVLAPDRDPLGITRPGERTRVSLGGARNPRWSGDGRELFFLSDDGAIQAAPVTRRDGRIEVGAPARLFVAPALDGRLDSKFEVSPDGQRFLVAVAAAVGSTAPVTVVLDWTAELAPRR